MRARSSEDAEPRDSGRVLGVDLGLKRTGLAVSDELRLTTRALDNLTPRSRAEDVSHLVQLCSDLEIRDVVVGYPSLPRSGDEGPMAKRARGFADALREALATVGVQVHLVNETGSSRLAARRLVESGVKRDKRKAALDSEAARVIIEHWIEEQRSRSARRAFDASDDEQPAEPEGTDGNDDPDRDG